MRNPVLLAAKKLRLDDNYKKIYISPDLTEAERKLVFELRQERNKLNKELGENTPFRYCIESSDSTRENNRNERQINIVNFNCKNVNCNYLYFYELLRSNDLIFLCETWHYKGEKIIKELRKRKST